MNKEKHHESLTPEVLQPITVQEATVPVSTVQEIEVPAGHVYIVALNADGTEKENSGFFYPEKSYRRIYSDTTKYSVKKKAL